MLDAKEKKMYYLQGKDVKIVTIEGDVIIGRCSEFIPSYNNEPEESSILLNSPTKNGKLCLWLMEVLKHEIKTIDIM